MLAPGDLLPVLLATAIFVGCLLAATLMLAAWRSHRDAVRIELAHRLRSGAPRVDLFLESETPSRLGGLGRWIATWEERAGVRPAPARLLLATLGLAAAGIAGGVVLLGPIGGVLGAGVGAVPGGWLVYLAREREAKLTQQLPEALDLITRGLRAGHAFNDALRTGAREFEEPLGGEFARVSERNRLGRDMRECLEDLIRRNPENFDLRLFGAAVLLQREAGGNLIENLDNLANTIRERLLFRGKVEAITSEVRFSAAVLGLLPFAVGSVLLMFRPRYLATLVESPLGQVILAGGVISLVTGILVMRWLAQVED